MSQRIDLDCRGLACPHPVINTKKALDSMNEGTLTVVVDNETAKENVSIFSSNAGFSTNVQKDGSDFKITITKGSPKPADETPEAMKADDGQPSTVYFITTNLLGQGSPDLGQVLMKSLMVSLNEMNPPPEALLFLNSGVMSTCEGSPVLEQIQSLSARGSAVISCGTCLEYYKLKDRLKVGRIGNMLEINSYLIGKSKAITIA